jgi:hypothetical protein
MSQYPAPPPSYGSGPAPKSYRDDDATSPLLGARSEAGPSNGIYNQPAEGDLPDDFKVRAHQPILAFALLTDVTPRLGTFPRCF